MKRSSQSSNRHIHTLTRISLTAVLCLASFGCPGNFSPPFDTTPADDNPNLPKLTTTLVASGFSRPIFVTAPPNDSTRLFVLEQHTGRVLIVNLETGEINPSTFITISNVAQGNEQGLLGLAFAPDYATSGRFYINYTLATGGSTDETRIIRGTVSDDPDTANASLEIIMTIEQPFANHNGGWIGFGPDGYLYIASGDGGSGNDPGDRAQDITDQLLGKILRIDVSGETGYTIPADNPFVGSEGDDEIWALGLRNPWRCSFDRMTGDFYMGDVGQGEIEEIDVIMPSSTSGQNFGWPCLEGELCLGDRDSCDCSDTSLTGPIYQYTHTNGCSVTGGYVYRGEQIPELQGAYFFADFCSHDIFSLKLDGTTSSDLIDWTQQLSPNSEIANISSFGEDAAGELYICDIFDGEIFKIVRDESTIEP